MNYIEQINNFWAYSEEIELKSSDISVYFALLKYNNSLGWIKSFRCDYAVICQYAGVSKNTFYNSIKKLHHHKFITYQEGQRNKLKPKVVILKLKNKRGTIKEQHENKTVNNTGTKREHEGNLYKQYKLSKLLNLLNLKTNSDNSFLEKKIIFLSDDFDFTEFKEETKKNKTPLSEIKISDVPDEDFQEYEISKAFYDLFDHYLTSINAPKNNLEKQTYEKWIWTTKIMLKNKEATMEQFRSVWNFLKDSEFWRPNILSPQKLRQQFTKLFTQSKQKKINGKNRPITPEELRDSINKKRAERGTL